MSRRIPTLLIGLVASLAAALPATGVQDAYGTGAGDAAAPSRDRSEPWGDDVLELFRTLPVQDHARVKPLDTLAGLRLFTLNGKRSLELDDLGKLGPSEWLLDVLFYPEQAKTYPSIRIQNDAILTMVGLASTKKRDWYSYVDLLPARERIKREADKVFAKGERRETLDIEDKQVRDLEIFLRRFESLLTMLDPLRIELPTNATPELRELFGDEPLVGVAGLLEKRDEFFALRQRGLDAADGNYEACMEVLRTVTEAMSMAHMSAFLFPPPEGADAQRLRDMGYSNIDEEEWWSLGDVITMGLQAGVPAQEAVLRDLQAVTLSVGSEAAFLGSLRTLHERLAGMATARGEYEYIDREVRLYQTHPFHMALGLFALGFVVMMLSFLSAKLAVLRYPGWVLGVVPLAYLVWGIVQRSIIRERPPVVTLYDTILFVTAVAVLVALLAEVFYRQRFALTMATLLGTVGMFMASNYELREVASAGDTMASVVAVLDTNYYLAIHVTTIAMGYSGGLLAGGLGIAWILGQLVGLGAKHKEGFRALSRATYGVVAFSLLFSIFGTVMGGVWANDSWGRFWGWDPKENGALLICIWMLLIVHLRLGGYIKARGQATMAALGAGIVSFSWWHVNMLEIGLHSYGKIDGIYDKLVVTYIFLLAVAGLSILDHYIKNGRTTAT